MVRKIALITALSIILSMHSYAEPPDNNNTPQVFNSDSFDVQSASPTMFNSTPGMTSKNLSGTATNTTGTSTDYTGSTRVFVDQGSNQSSFDSPITSNSSLDSNVAQGFTASNQAELDAISSQFDVLDGVEPLDIDSSSGITEWNTPTLPAAPTTITTGDLAQAAFMAECMAECLGQGTPAADPMTGYPVTFDAAATLEQCEELCADITGPEDGQCDPTTHGQELDEAPTSNLCLVGTPSAVSGIGPWTWTCSEGNIIGDPASCSTVGTASDGYFWSWTLTDVTASCGFCGSAQHIYNYSYNDPTNNECRDVYGVWDDTFDGVANGLPCDPNVDVMVACICDNTDCGSNRLKMECLQAP